MNLEGRNNKYNFNNVKPKKQGYREFVDSNQPIVNLPDKLSPGPVNQVYSHANQNMNHQYNQRSNDNEKTYDFYQKAYNQSKAFKYPEFDPKNPKPLYQQRNNNSYGAPPTAPPAVPPRKDNKQKTMNILGINDGTSNSNKMDKPVAPQLPSRNKNNIVEPPSLPSRNKDRVYKFIDSVQNSHTALQPIYHAPGFPVNNPFPSMPDPKAYINPNNAPRSPELGPKFNFPMPMPSIPDITQYSTSFPTNFEEADKEIIVPVNEIANLKIDTNGINYNNKIKRFDEQSTKSEVSNTNTSNVISPNSVSNMTLSSNVSNTTPANVTNVILNSNITTMSPSTNTPNMLFSDKPKKEGSPRASKSLNSERYQFSQFKVNPPSPSQNETGNFINVVNANSDVSPPPTVMSTCKPVDPLQSTNPFSPEAEEFDFFQKEFENLKDISKRALFVHIYIEREIKFYNSLKTIQNFISKRVHDSQIFDEDTKTEAIETILFNIPKILAFYKGFIHALIERYRLEHQGIKDVNYGDVFLRYINEFIHFVEFTRHYNNIKEYIQTAQNNSMKFRLWLQNVEKQCFSKEMSISDYLSSLRYHLDPHVSQLQEMFQETKSTNNDIYVFEMVINSFKNIVDDISNVRDSNDLEEEKHDKRMTYLPDHMQHLSQTLLICNELENQIEVNGYIDFDGSDFTSSIPKDLTEGLSENEFKRQEAIFELCRTERDYLRDLITIRKVFIEGLKSTQCYPANQVDIIVHKLFLNYLDIKKIHEPLCVGLSSRQKNTPVINNIGDILLKWAEQLEPYNIYGARIQFATDFASKEKARNSKFQAFLEECSQKKELKRLTIDSFISLPTRRLARYPLLFKEIMKRTPEDNEDFKLIPQALEHLNRQLSFINQTKGETDSKLRLRAVSDRLEDPNHMLEYPHIDLQLEDSDRKLIKEGDAKLVKGSIQLKIFLFDHYLLLTKEHELSEDIVEYEVFKKPIDLAKLSISASVTATMLQVAMGNNFFGSVFSSGSSNTPDPKVCISVYNHDTKETLYLAFNNEREQTTWVSAFEEATQSNE